MTIIWKSCPEEQDVSRPCCMASTGVWRRDGKAFPGTKGRKGRLALEQVHPCLCYSREGGTDSQQAPTVCWALWQGRCTCLFRFFSSCRGWGMSQGSCWKQTQQDMVLSARVDIPKHHSLSCLTHRNSLSYSAGSRGQAVHMVEFWWGPIFLFVDSYLLTMSSLHLFLQGH